MSRRRHVLMSLIAGVGLLAACSDSSSTTAPSVLPIRKVESGAVDVKITPIQFDDSGAMFAIVLDTHSVELSMDVAASSALDVDGRSWPVTGWTGSGPGGHHREGELRFTAAGPRSGTATLTIAGLPEPVETTWDIGGS